MNSSGGDNDTSVLHKSTVVMQYVDKGFEAKDKCVPADAKALVDVRIHAYAQRGRHRERAEVKVLLHTMEMLVLIQRAIPTFESVALNERDLRRNKQNIRSIPSFRAIL
jgi:hypothetical protein